MWVYKMKMFFHEYLRKIFPLISILMLIPLIVLLLIGKFTLDSLLTVYLFESGILFILTFFTTPRKPVKKEKKKLPLNYIFGFSALTIFTLGFLIYLIFGR